MKLLHTSDDGSTISECETFEDVAEAFGCVGFTLPGRMLSPPKDQGQTLEEDPSQPVPELPEQNNSEETPNG